MQYSKTAFGINGSVTMDPIQSGVFQLGQRVGFTKTDSYQANMLYRCNGLSACIFSSFVKLPSGEVPDGNIFGGPVTSRRQPGPLNLSF